MTEELLTTEDLRRILGVSERSIRRLVAAGRLRAVHPTPGTTRFTQREVAAFIASLEGRRVA